MVFEGDFGCVGACGCVWVCVGVFAGVLVIGSAGIAIGAMAFPHRQLGAEKADVRNPHLLYTVNINQIRVYRIGTYGVYPPISATTYKLER